jgi:hypothetical protein
MPLQGDVLYIPDYQELVTNTYVGDELNNTADGFYKTENPDGTIRSVVGEYFVLPDAQGLFVRAAGQNAKYKMANNTPYDGGAIGGFISDAVVKMVGSFVSKGSNSADGAAVVSSGGGCFIVSQTSGTSIRVQVDSQTGNNSVVMFDNSSQVNTADETRGASVSAFLCITLGSAI